MGKKHCKKVAQNGGNQWTESGFCHIIRVLGNHWSDDFIGGLQMKKVNIFVKLLGAFLVPIIMMIGLGMFSYQTASRSTMEKYEQSAGSTVASVAEYMKLLTQTVESGTAELLTSDQVKNYFGMNANSKDKTKEASSYNEMKDAILKQTSSTKYTANVHEFAQLGRSVSSTTKDAPMKVAFPDTAYDDFQKREGAVFEDSTVKSVWMGTHPYIDEMTEITTADYSLSYVKRFVTGKGFIAIDIRMDTISEVLGKMDFGTGSYASLVTADGREINIVGGEVNEDVLYEGIDLTPEGDAESVSRYVTMNGKKYLLLASPVGETQITVCALIPQSSILDEAAGLKRTTIIFVLLASAIAIFIGILLSNDIRRTLGTISKCMKVASEGDLLVQIPTKKRRDEFGLVSSSIGKMLGGVKELLQQVQRFGGDVDTSAEQVADTTSQILSSMEEVNIALSNVEADVVSQAHDAGDGYQMMAAFGDKINRMNETVDSMGSMMQSTIGSIERGTTMVDELKRTATATGTITRELVDHVENVSEQSTAIARIIETINDIAEETNLLSLNASIEAARAGESGRGFAVVAQSIGKLAAQSMSAGNEITQIVASIEEATKTAAESAGQTEQNVDYQMKALEETVAVFHEINETVQSLVSNLQAITGGMTELVADKDEVLLKIQAVSQASESASAATTEVTASISEQVGFLKGLTRDAEHLQSQTRELEKAMSRFKI